MFGDGGPVVRSTTEEASAFMEAVDVENGEYDIVYDEMGLILRPQVRDRQVHLLPTESGDYGDLIRRLSEWCQTTEYLSTPTRATSLRKWLGGLLNPSGPLLAKTPSLAIRMIHGSTPPTFDT